MNDSGNGIFSFLFFSVFFLKKLKMSVGAAFFPLASAPTQTLSLKKMKNVTSSGIFAQTHQ
jgi:hypothetical protein